MSTLNVRGIEDEAAERIKRAAAARGITIGEFLARLVDFWEVARAQADGGEFELGSELESRGLQTIRS